GWLRGDFELLQHAELRVDLLAFGDSARHEVAPGRKGESHPRLAAGHHARQAAHGHRGWWAFTPPVPRPEVGNRLALGKPVDRDRVNSFSDVGDVNDLRASSERLREREVKVLEP